MKKFELEQMLENPNAVKTLLDWATKYEARRDPLVFPSPAPGGQAHKVEAAPDVARPSKEEIAANDASIAARDLLSGVERFIPEVAKKSSVEALEFFASRFRENPTKQNLFLLQGAINRVTTGGPLDQHDKTAVTAATKLFHKKLKPGKTDDIWYMAFENADFNGRFVFDDLVPGWIYWRRPELGSVGLNDALSSLIVGCSNDEVGGEVILFENNGYNGRYAKFNAVPGSTVGINYVGDSFNDLASSTLIVRRFANQLIPFPVGDAVPPDQIANLINQQSGISPAGNPTFTWDMWPTGPTYGQDPHPNDPGKRFVYVIIPITVHTPWPWPDYYAQVRFWIYLFVDSNGTLQGSVDWWGEYVESGTIHDSVRDQLKQKIPGIIPQVNGLLSTALGPVALGGPYRLSYFLPGRNHATGSTADDVSIVLVRA